MPISELAMKVIQISGKTITIKYDLSKPVGPCSRTANTERAKELLGWRPKVSLEEGLVKVYRWVEQQLLGKK